MPDRTCTVTGCGRKHLARGYCMTHYHRMRDHGTTDPQPRRPRPKMVHRCKIADCQKQALSLGMCEMHYTRQRRNGHPLTLRGYTQGRGPDHANWIGDRVTYIGAHCRLKRERGLATQFSCIDCGNHADEWSYNHSDPNELHDPQRNCGYSADPDYYDPRCKTCHNRFDQRTDRQRLASGRYAPRASA